jgi:hypothetical protein
MTCDRNMKALLEKALPFVERIAATAPTTPSRHQRKVEAAQIADQIRAALAA